ncbi:GNAT family N-acetyltransferase [Defluviitalea phaphyphila]|uniref:GNAT family N-acetyltransferase n=1 Tax=Defluviitalea phaphyphila TaxID=1473580 RepID=UPI000731C6B6|nr:GNAT family N-acetyltransferase [Defluviitalea phaphyphila]
MEVSSFNDDYHQVGQLVINFLYPHYKTIEQMKRDWENKNLILLTAIENGEIIGFGGLDLVRQDGEPNADLYGIVIDPRYRRQGIGTRLMKSLINKAKEEGILSIYTKVEEKRKDIINFLTNQGFEYKRSLFKLEMNEPIIQDVESPEGIRIENTKRIQNKEEFLKTYKEIFINIKNKEKQIEKFLNPNNNYEIFLMYRVSTRTKKEKLIGFCSVENIKEEKGINRSIDSLGVIDKYGRRGMGKILYMTVLNYYWSLKDTKKISITLRSSSENIKKFYLSCGMEEKQIIEVYKYKI